METDILIKKVETLPNDLKKEVEDFVDFLIFKNNGLDNIHHVQEEDSSYQYVENSLKVKKLASKPVFGSGKGIFGKIADDFDKPLDAMNDYM